jgi:hypothetical protein
VNDVYILGSYHLWYGWRYTGDIGGGGMFRVGDRWTFNDRQYRLLLSDPDILFNGNSRGSSHPDRRVMSNRAVEREVTNVGLVTGSAWQVFQSINRAPLDLNFTYEDTSVSRVTDVYDNTDQNGANSRNPEMHWIPTAYDGQNFYNNRAQVPWQ